VAPTRKRVLLADDDTDTTLVLKDRLESFGYEVTEVSNGREVLEEIKCERYGAVVMDVKMPEMDGFQALSDTAGDYDHFDRGEQGGRDG